LASELSQRLIDINNDNTIDATARKEHLLAAAASQSNPMWITAVACMRYGDLFASGSQDGLIRLWRVKDAHKSAFQPFMTVECAGCVNALQFTGDGRYLVAAVGQEHRLGRWTRLKEARNGLLVIELISTTANAINN
jgi:ribosomal RNA-processing protein 9